MVLIFQIISSYNLWSEFSIIIYLRCLLKHRVLHYTSEKACVVLHNMCITYNEPEPLDNVIDIDFGMYGNNTGQHENDSSNDLDNGRRVRACVVRNFGQNEQ